MAPVKQRRRYVSGNPVKFGLKEEGMKQALFHRVSGKAMRIYSFSWESYQCK